MTYIVIDKKGQSKRFEGTRAVAMGRPREFDVEGALDRALEVFWRNGYEGASIADLTVAMGINPPSLYAAFGNKQALFRKALDRYAQKRTAYWQDAFEAPTARGTVEHLLRKGADFLSEECNPPGCLFVRSTLSCSEAGEAVRRELTARRVAAEAALRERLERAKIEGEMPPHLDPAEYARYILTIMEGMSVRAAGGANRRELHGIVDLALSTWPA
jgi:AcrR family transcriptional regulator